MYIREQEIKISYAHIAQTYNWYTSSKSGPREELIGINIPNKI